MQLNFQIFRKQAKRLWLWLVRKDIIIFLLFVGLVTLFWWGRVMSSPREIYLHIPITYSDINQQLVLNKELPQTITVAIKDNGKQLRQISKQQLHLDINLSTFITEEDGTLNLTSDFLRSRIQDLLPGSTAIQHITPEFIETTYYLQKQKTVPVHVLAQLTLAPQHQFLGDVIVIPNQVQVLGSQQAIDSIELVYTDSIHLSNIRDSISVIAQLQAPNGVRIHPSSVQVQWKTELFTDKSFTLPIQTIGVPDGEHMRLFPNEAKLTVRVGISQFSQVDQTDIKAICRYPQQSNNTLPIEVITKNPYITNIRISPTEVEYIIER